MTLDHYITWKLFLKPGPETDVPVVEFGAVMSPVSRCEPYWGSMTQLLAPHLANWQYRSHV